MKKKLYPLLFVCSAVCFSTGGLFVKSIPWNPLAINGGRSLIAAAVIFLYMKLRRHKIVLNKSVLLCGMSMAATSLLFVFANKLTTAAAAIILEYTAPVFIIVFSLLFFRKRPDKLDVTVIPIIACGVLCFFFDSLTGGTTVSSPLLGNLLGLISGMTYAVVFMMKMMPGSDNLSSVFTGCIIGTVVGLPFTVQEMTVPGQCTPQVLCILLALGVIQFAVSYICMAEGLEYTPAFAASLISIIEPILNPLLTAAVLGEMVGLPTILGAVIVLGAVLCYNLLKARQENQSNQTSKESL